MNGICRPLGILQVNLRQSYCRKCVFLHEQSVHVIHVWCQLLNSIHISKLSTAVRMAVWLNCHNQHLWHHTLRHFRAPRNPGNDVCAFPIPWMKKTGLGMQTLYKIKCYYHLTISTLFASSPNILTRICSAHNTYNSSQLEHHYTASQSHRTRNTHKTIN